jgi:uncharacterized DUF497 family protein
MNIEIEFDLIKSNQNIKSRGIDFNSANHFQWNSALIIEDTRKDYGEKRYSTIGFIKDRLHVMIFTPKETAIRVISLRKANKREITKYNNYQKNN